MPLGIDIGGTFIKVFDGRVKRKIRTPKSHEELIETLANLIGEERRVAVAVAGLVDREEGTVVESPNLPFLREREIGKELEERVGTGVRLINDATAAAYGEFISGSGRGAELFICITLGTGLGSGAVIGGKPLEGVNGAAMEVGHTTVCINGWPCHCGRRGCLEAYASSYGLERHYFLLTGKERSSFEVIERAKEGEEEALKALRELARYLSVGITNILHTFNPDAVAIAGGIPENFPLLINWCREEVEKRAFKLTTRKLKLVKAELGEFSGAVGAYLFSG